MRSSGAGFGRIVSGAVALLGAWSSSSAWPAAATSAGSRSTRPPPGSPTPSAPRPGCAARPTSSSSNSAAGTDVAGLHRRRRRRATRTSSPRCKFSVDQKRASYQSSKLDTCLMTIQSSDCTALNVTNHVAGIPGCESFTTPLVADRVAPARRTTSASTAGATSRRARTTATGSARRSCGRGSRARPRAGPAAARTPSATSKGRQRQLGRSLRAGLRHRRHLRRRPPVHEPQLQLQRRQRHDLRRPPTTPPPAMCFYSSGCSEAGGRPGAGHAAALRRRSRRSPSRGPAARAATADFRRGRAARRFGYARGMPDATDRDVPRDAQSPAGTARLRHRPRHGVPRLRRARPAGQDAAGQGALPVPGVPLLRLLLHVKIRPAVSIPRPHVRRLGEGRLQRPSPNKEIDHALHDDCEGASRSPRPGCCRPRPQLAAMGKYNEELQKAGVLLDLSGLKPTSAGARVQFSGGKRDGHRRPVHRGQGADRRLLDHPGQVQRGGDRVGQADPGRGGARWPRSSCAPSSSWRTSPPGRRSRPAKELGKKLPASAAPRKR